jgi:hypothetical protein
MHLRRGKQGPRHRLNAGRAVADDRVVSTGMARSMGSRGRRRLMTVKAGSLR